MRDAFKVPQIIMRIFLIIFITFVNGISLVAGHWVGLIGLLCASWLVWDLGRMIDYRRELERRKQ